MLEVDGGAAGEGGLTDEPPPSYFDITRSASGRRRSSVDNITTVH
jgi:hypothetical protein